MTPSSSKTPLDIAREEREYLANRNAALYRSARRSERLLEVSEKGAFRWGYAAGFMSFLMVFLFLGWLDVISINL